MAGRTDLEQLVYTLSADVSQLSKQTEKALAIIRDGGKRGAKEIENAGDGIWAKFFGKTDPGEALQKIFANARFATLEEGGAKIRIFGSALEALGPWGLAAAAGLAAFGIGLEQAEKALEFADALEKQAKQAHLTTDEYQELQYAVKELGGDATQVAPAMEQFGITLGKAQENSAKAVNAFKAIHIDKSQLDNLHSVGDALELVIARIGDLKDVHQKDTAVEQLGLSGIKPAVEAGLAKYEELKQAARELGLVMDSSVIAKGAELNRQADVLKQKIDVDVKTAFVELGPVLVKLLGWLAQMADKATAIANAFLPMESKTTSHLQSLISQYQARDQGPLGFVYRAGDQKRIFDAQFELAKRGAEGGADGGGIPTGNSSLADIGHHPKGITPEQLSANSAAAVDAAVKDELAARKELVTNILALASLAEDEVQAELKAKVDKLDGQLAEKKITKAAHDRAVTLEEQAADEKKQKIARDASWNDDEQYFKSQQVIAGYYSQISQISAGLARTFQQRYDIEHKELLQRQKEERDALKRDLDHQVALDPTQKSHADTQMASFMDLQAAQRKQFDQANLAPFAKYFDQAPKTIEELNDKFKQMDVEGLANLNSGLADAIVNAKSLGDVGAQVFKQLAAQVLQMLFQAGEAKAFAFLGFASGGSVNGPGTSRSDSIPAMLSNGEFVVNASAAGRYRHLLEAINSGHAPHLANGGLVGASALLSNLRGPAAGVVRQSGLTVIDQRQFHLEGTVLSDQLFSAISDSETRATINGAALGHQKTMQRLSQTRANTLGRG